MGMLSLFCHLVRHILCGSHHVSLAVYVFIVVVAVEQLLAKFRSEAFEESEFKVFFLDLIAPDRAWDLNF